MNNEVIKTFVNNHSFFNYGKFPFIDPQTARVTCAFPIGRPINSINNSEINIYDTIWVVRSHTPDLSNSIRKAIVIEIIYENGHMCFRLDDGYKYSSLDYNVSGDNFYNGHYCFKKHDDAMEYAKKLNKVWLKPRTDVIYHGLRIDIAFIPEEYRDRFTSAYQVYCGDVFAGSFLF